MIVMTSPTPEDVQTYLNRQQQGAAIAAQFDNLPEADHDETGAVRRGLDAEAERLGEQSAALVSSYRDAQADLQSIRNAIADGVADPAEMTRRLAKIRADIANLNRRASATTQRAESLKVRREHPDEYAASLAEKYPALRR